MIQYKTQQKMNHQVAMFNWSTNNLTKFRRGGEAMNHSNSETNTGISLTLRILSTRVGIEVRSC